MKKFIDLGLSPKVMKAINDVGYDTPTPIQSEAIPHALEGRDVLGIAQTGTGKTAGFTLPIVGKYIHFLNFLYLERTENDTQVGECFFL